MKTAALAKALNLCKGSLMGMDFIPALTHFFFTPNDVHAYNDISAVIVSLKTGLEVGIRGESLLGVVATLGEELTLELTEDEEKVKIVSGRARIELPALAGENGLFEFPDDDPVLEIEVNEDLIRGLSKCCGTVGMTALQREYTGITLSLLKGAVRIYSTDDTRLSCYEASEDVVLEATTKKGDWLIPVQSCRQFVDAWATLKKELPEDEPTVLKFAEKWCSMHLGDTVVFSKLMPEKAPDYKAMIEKILPETVQWKNIPAGMPSALKRAEVLTSRETQPKLKMWMESKTLTIQVGKESTLGSFREAFTCVGIDPVSLYLTPEKVREAADNADSMALHDQCLAFKSGSYRCFVSPLSVEDEGE